MKQAFEVMADHEAGTLGKERKEKGFKKNVKEEKQGKVSGGKEKEGKKVTFRGVKGEEEKGLKEVIEEVIRGVMEKFREEVGREVEKMKKKCERGVREIEERIGRIEKVVDEMREENIVDRDVIGDMDSEEGRSVRGISDKRRGSRFGRTHSRGSSVWSLDRFSERSGEGEIDRIERMKEERKSNIKIKGDIGKIKVTKEGIEKFIKEKIGIEIRITDCRTSGNVIIATIEEEDMKKEVMRID